MNVLKYAPQSLKQGTLYRRLSTQRRLRQLQKQIAAARPLKIVIGAGPTKFPGWLETDKELLNITSPADWRRLFRPESIDRLLAEHVFEHLDGSQCRIALGECHRYLKPGGSLRLAVPDGFHPSPEYLDAVKPGGSGPDSEDHKVLFNYQTLGRIASEMNFSCEFLEYFDEEGQFRRRSWRVEDGFVQRSEHYDPRNKEHPLSYTSLIVDLRPQPSAGSEPDIR